MAATNVQSLAGDLLSLPEDMAIRLLNFTPYPLLDQLFNVSPQLAQKYSNLYQVGLQSYQDGGLSQSEFDTNRTQEEESDRISNEYSSISTYFSINVLELVLESMSQAIVNTPLPKSGNQIILTLDVLNNYWLLYAYNNGLLQNGYITPDQLMDTLFSPLYTKYDINPPKPFRQEVLTQMLTEYIDHNTPITSELHHDEIENTIFTYATELHNQLTALGPQLATNPESIVTDTEYVMEALEEDGNAS